MNRNILGSKKRKNSIPTLGFPFLVLLSLCAIQSTSAQQNSCVKDAGADTKKQSAVLCEHNAVITLDESCSAKVEETIRVPFWNGAFRRVILLPRFQSRAQESVTMVRSPPPSLGSRANRSETLVANIQVFLEEEEKKPSKVILKTYDMTFSAPGAVDAAETWSLSYTVRNAVQFNGNCAKRYTEFQRTGRNNMITYWKPEAISVYRIDLATVKFRALLRVGANGVPARYIESGKRYYGAGAAYDDGIKYEEGEWKVVSMTMPSTSTSDLLRADFAAFHGDFEEDEEKMKCKETEDCLAQKSINNDLGDDENSRSDGGDKSPALSKAAIAGISGASGGIIGLLLLLCIGKRIKEKRKKEEDMGSDIEGGPRSLKVRDGGPISISGPAASQLVADKETVLSLDLSPDDEEFEPTSAEKSLSPKQCVRDDFTYETLHVKEANPDSPGKGTAESPKSKKGTAESPKSKKQPKHFK